MIALITEKYKIYLLVSEWIPSFYLYYTVKPVNLESIMPAIPALLAYWALKIMSHDISCILKNSLSTPVAFQELRKVNHSSNRDYRKSELNLYNL